LELTDKLKDLFEKDPNFKEYFSLHSYSMQPRPTIFFEYKGHLISYSLCKIEFDGEKYSADLKKERERGPQNQWDSQQYERTNRDQP
jgi:hypothetical protein